MGRWWPSVGWSWVARTAVIGGLAWSSIASTAWGRPADAAEPAEEPAPAAAAPAAETADAAAEENAPAAPPAAQKGDFERLEQDFSSYLHFALIGNFQMADNVAKSLLQHPDVNPLSKEGAEQLLALSDKYENSVETLLLLVSNSPVGENAQRVLGLIYAAHRQARMDPARIKENIERLAGSPTQRAFGMDRLQESGEYAVPWMLEALADPGRQNLQPFILRALPQLGKKAVNPLVQALSLQNDVIQRFAAQTLGQIGYPQALPYLKRLAADERENQAVRQAAGEAVGRIVVADPGAKEAPATDLFAALAEQYYAGAESVGPDPREERANVWFPGEGTVYPIEVPRAIYNPVMCMRSCEASLALAKDQPPVAALWVAANFRREARLGLDVQTEAPAQADDLTRPPNYPRSIYFARSAGPDVCRLVLSRGVHDRDREVSLGAIAALAVTAGPAAMTSTAGGNSMSLVEALHFPELLVRIRAALALGRSMPRTTFEGAEDVVRVLASALSLTGRQYYLLIEPDKALRDQLQTELARRGANLIVAARAEEALSRAAKELTHLDGVFIGSDIQQPTVIEAIRAIRQHPRFGLVPVMVYIKKTDNTLADRIKGEDNRVGVVFVTNGDGAAAPKLAEAIAQQYPRTAGRYGHVPLTPELSLALAMDAATTLQLMAVRDSEVFDLRPAERSLTEALAHPSEPLRMACLWVLALLDSPTAQRAIAGVALAPAQSEPLRVGAFGALAESGRHFGSRLEAQGLNTLIQQALSEPNLVLRTAASQALGALNPPGTRAADVILTQPSAPPAAPAQTQPAQ